MLPTTRSLILAILLMVSPSLGGAADFVYRPVGLKIYQADEVVIARVPGGPMRLGVYVHSISRELRELFEARGAGGGFGAAIVVIARPGQLSRHWVLARTELPTDLRSAIQNAVDSLPTPTVRNGPVAFAVMFEAWGGGPLPTVPKPALPTPVEWLRALEKQAQYPMQDSDLDRVWLP